MPPPLAGLSHTTKLERARDTVSTRARGALSQEKRLPTTSQYQDAASFIESYLAKHYRDRIRISDLALAISMSIRSVQNVCHSQWGCSPLRVIKNYRMQRLFEMIRHDPCPALRYHLDRCGLIGTQADRRLFEEIHGISMRNHQMNSRDVQAQENSD